MPCLIPFVCTLLVASPHPYTDPAAPMKTSGRHIGLGAGPGYMNVAPDYTVTRDGGEVAYPVYILRNSQEDR